MELLEVIRKSNEKLQEENQSLKKRCDKMKTKIEILDAWLSRMPIEIFCEELKRRYLTDYIEVGTEEKFFIATKKGVVEKSGRNIIFTIKY